MSRRPDRRGPLKPQRPPAPQEALPQARIALWGLFGMGMLCAALALFFDPIGTSPDTGVIDLGPRGTRWLLGGFAAYFWGAWLWTLWRRPTDAG